MKIAFVLVVLLSALSVSAQPVRSVEDDKVFTTALGTYDVMGATDIGTKLFLIGQGSGREIGFAPFRNQPTAFAATKLGLMALTNYLLIAKLHPQHPRLARWIAIGAAGLETSLVVRNTRLQR
jgi:hypothetical protein